jgi:hypothetical protein
VKAKLLRLLSVVGLVLAALASLDLTGYTALLPPAYAGKALAAGLIIAALRDLILAIGDVADDGKRNHSWQPLVVWMVVPLFLLALPSCSVRLGADGSKDATLDGPGAAQAVLAVGKVLADKP